MLDYALAYAALGWRILPIQPKSKLPFAGSSGAKDATTKEEIIRAWWRIHPTANIAIALGKESNLIAIDLDVDHSPGVNGIAEWEKLVAKEEIQRTPQTITGGGGSHVLFAWTDRFDKATVKFAPGVDSRSDGLYIVAPPSLHPSGRAYKWLTPPDVTPAPFPNWLVPLKGNLAGLNHGGVIVPDVEAFKRAMAYLATIEPAISGSGGHAATFRAACECFRFGLTESESWEAMRWYNANKCHPEWTEKELRHKIRQGRKEVDSNGKFGAKLDEGENRDRELQSHYLQEASPAISIAPPSAPPSALPAKAFPADLLDPPGLVGDIVRWINRTAYKRQPVLALGNALSFFGAVVGRKVRTPTDLRSNLYCLGVGESGCGKDHSRKAIKKICEAAGVTDQLLSGEDISSDSAIVMAISKRPTTLFQLDEIGHFLCNVNGKFAPTHMKAIIPELMKLFGSANTRYLGKEYSSKDRTDVDEPNACLYGTTVPGRLYDGLEPAQLYDGLLSRMLVFSSDDPDPEPQGALPEDVPDSIRMEVEAWHSRDMNPPRSLAGLIPGVPPVVRVVSLDSQATARINQFSADCRREQASARDGSGIDVIWSRAAEHARKVALVMACGCEYQTPAVTGDVADWSCRLVDCCVRRFVDAIKGSMSGSEFGKQQLKILKIIKMHSANGIALNKIGIALRSEGMSSRARRESLEELLMRGEIRIESKETKGRPTTLYFPT